MLVRRFLLKMIAPAVVVTALGFSLFLDARNSSRASGLVLGQGYTDYGGHYENPLERSRQYEAVRDLTGSVTGSLVDDSDASISGIEVELVPSLKSGTNDGTRLNVIGRNAQGQFVFSRVDPGQYIVAMQMRGAPDGRHPFAGTYYPGVDAEADADRVYVMTGAALDLHPVQLRRVDVVTVKVNVQFEDGSRPNRSNLLFHNLSFPQQAVIGDEAPDIENGEGEFTLPVGFDYYASAKVDCDSGPRIETRESRLRQHLHVVNDSFPDELTLLIPGPPCPLWSPK